MAFVRWRKKCAQLLATVYKDGKSQQILLLSLWGYYVPLVTRQDVAKRFPDIPVDWYAVEQALAHGPPHQPAPPEHMRWAEAEFLLRELSVAIRRQKGWSQDASVLDKAADVLTSWRAMNVELSGEKTPIRSSDDQTVPQGAPP